MILVGDTFHNFVDGILIAAAFMEDPRLGIVTALAIVAHEIPQEVGDFVILLHSGYTKARALAFNLLSSLATLVGGAAGLLRAVAGAGGGARPAGAGGGEHDLCRGCRPDSRAAQAAGTERDRSAGAIDRAGHRRRSSLTTRSLGRAARRLR